MWPFKKNRDQLGKDELAEVKIEEAADEMLASREKDLTEEEKELLAHPPITEEVEDDDTTGVVDLAVDSVRFARRKAMTGAITSRDLRRSIAPKTPPPRTRKRSTFAPLFYRQTEEKV